MRLGLKFATGDIIIIQDADLELNPQEYGILLAPVLGGRDRRRLRLALPQADRTAFPFARASPTGA